MMSQLRAKTKIIMLVTAAAFVLLMVMEDFDFIGGGMGAQLRGGELGRVNGEVVTFEEFNEIYRDLVAQRQEESPGSLTTADTREIEDRAWDQLVTQKLIEQELQRRGIGVTAQEIRQAARTSPPPQFLQNEIFYTDGQFDITKYHQFLASPTIDSRLLLQMEAYYRTMIPRSKLFQQVISGFYVTDGELWRDWRDQHERATVRYIAIDPAVVVTDAGVSVSEREVSDFYNRHRDDFARPARASVRLVSLDKRPTAADTAAVRERARELRQEILAGADFGEVAERESADPGSASRGGSLGTFQRGQMVPPFEEAVWSQPVGQVGDPVLTQFGYHLILVESRDGDEAQARHMLLALERTRDSEAGLLVRADSVEALARTRSVEEIGEEMGLRVRTLELNAELRFIPGVGRVDDALMWVFEDEAEIGEVGPLFETQEVFYVVELVERERERRLTLEEATPTIRTQLGQQKMLERARIFAREVVDQARRGTPLAELAASRDELTVREAGPFARIDFVPGLGFANAAVGVAFGLQPGEVSEAVEADGMLFILELVERTEADRDAWEEQKPAQRAQVQGLMQQERVNQFVESLRERARIVDNRAVALQRARV